MAGGAAERECCRADDELFHEVERLVGGGSKREVVRRALLEVTRQELARQLVRVRGDDLELSEPARRRFDGDELDGPPR